MPSAITRSPWCLTSAVSDTHLICHLYHRRYRIPTNSFAAAHPADQVPPLSSSPSLAIAVPSLARSRRPVALAVPCSPSLSRHALLETQDCPLLSRRSTLPSPPALARALPSFTVHCRPRTRRHLCIALVLPGIVCSNWEAVLGADCLCSTLTTLGATTIEIRGEWGDW